MHNDLELAFAPGTVGDHQEVLFILGFHLNPSFPVLELLRGHNLPQNILQIQPCEILLPLWIPNQIQLKPALLTWHLHKDLDPFERGYLQLEVKVVEEVGAVDAVAAVGFLQVGGDQLLLDYALGGELGKCDLEKCVRGDGVLDGVGGGCLGSYEEHVFGAFFGGLEDEHVAVDSLVSVKFSDSVVHSLNPTPRVVIQLDHQRLAQRILPLLLPQTSVMSFQKHPQLDIFLTGWYLQQVLVTAV